MWDTDPQINSNTDHTDIWWELHSRDCWHWIPSLRASLRLVLVNFKNFAWRSKLAHLVHKFTPVKHFPFPLNMNPIIKSNTVLICTSYWTHEANNSASLTPLSGHILNYWQTEGELSRGADFQMEHLKKINTVLWKTIHLHFLSSTTSLKC